MNSLIFSSNYISSIQIEEHYSTCNFSCKSGNICSFDMNTVSNQPHFHNCYELCLILSGEGAFIYTDNQYNIKVGDIFVADPTNVHEIRVAKSKELQLLFLFFEISNINNTIPQSIEDNIIQSFLKSHKVISYTQKHLISYCEFIQNYYSVAHTNGFGIYQAIKNLILESLQLLANKNSRIADTNVVMPTPLMLALDYIDRHLNERIKVNDIALHCCTSVRNLQLLFKKHLTKTVIGYINEKKLILASHYLIRQFSVNDTSNQVGIDNPAHFTRLFKKHFFITPKKFQENNLFVSNEFGRRQQVHPII